MPFSRTHQCLIGRPDPLNRADAVIRQIKRASARFPIIGLLEYVNLVNRNIKRNPISTLVNISRTNENQDSAAPIFIYTLKEKLLCHVRSYPSHTPVLNPRRIQIPAPKSALPHRVKRTRPTSSALPRQVSKKVPQRKNHENHHRLQS